MFGDSLCAFPSAHAPAPPETELHGDLLIGAASGTGPQRLSGASSRSPGRAEDERLPGEPQPAVGPGGRTASGLEILARTTCAAHAQRHAGSRGLRAPVLPHGPRASRVEASQAISRWRSGERSSKADQRDSLESTPVNAAPPKRSTTEDRLILTIMTDAPAHLGPPRARRSRLRPRSVTRPSHPAAILRRNFP